MNNIIGNGYNVKVMTDDEYDIIKFLKRNNGCTYSRLRLFRKRAIWRKWLPKLECRISGWGEKVYDV